MNIDFSTLYLYLVNLETITYYHSNNDGTFADPITIHNCRVWDNERFFETSGFEVDLAKIYSQCDVYQNELNILESSIVPVRGDKLIRSDSTTYFVESNDNDDERLMVHRLKISLD